MLLFTIVPTDKLEILYNYRFGGGSSVYQGSQKYALRDFTQQFHKLELKGSNFFVRGYITATDAGDSYNMAALGGVLNERISPTATPMGAGICTDFYFGKARFRAWSSCR